MAGAVWNAKVIQLMKPDPNWHCRIGWVYEGAMRELRTRKPPKRRRWWVTKVALTSK